MRPRWLMRNEMLSQRSTTDRAELSSVWRCLPIGRAACLGAPALEDDSPAFILEPNRIGGKLCPSPSRAILRDSLHFEEAETHA